MAFKKKKKAVSKKHSHQAPFRCAILLILFKNAMTNVSYDRKKKEEPEIFLHAAICCVTSQREASSAWEPTHGTSPWRLHAVSVRCKRKWIKEGASKKWPK